MSAQPQPAPPGHNRFNVDDVRQDFPILRQVVHGHPLVYLDNAATAQKPQAVIDTVRAFYERDNAAVHRSVHALSERATLAYEQARDTAARFINAADRKEVVFVRGTTEGINLVAQAYARPRLARGDEIAVSHMEHHSNIVPWQILARHTGAQLRVIPVTDEGVLDLDAYRELLGPRTRIVALNHVANALGTINPVAEVAKAAHAVGAALVVDGAQAAPHIPIDVQALGADFYALSSHKAYGPTGAGVLWGRAALLEEMEPYQGGGEMILKVSFDDTTYNVLPHKFEAGTPNVAGSVGMAAAFEYLMALDWEAVMAHEDDVLQYASAQLDKVPGVRIIGTAPEKTGVLSFVVDGVHPHDIGTVVDREGVAIRTGHHCAMPLMQRFDVPATSRASFGLYNTRDDADRLVGAITKVQAMFGR
ncbi:MAG: cysteine desulfurase [Gammaproteobacteria bacterium]